MLHILEAKIDSKNIFLMELEDGITAIFRSMKLSEFIGYNDFLASYPQQRTEAEEFIFEKYTVQFVDQMAGMFYLQGSEEETFATYEELFNMIASGAISSISSAILSVSGPQTTEQLEEQLSLSRYTEQGNLINTILSILSSVYHLDTDKLKKEKTWQEILSIYAQSESILTQQVPELPLKIDRE